MAPINDIINVKRKKDFFDFNFFIPNSSRWSKSIDLANDPKTNRNNKVDNIIRITCSESKIPIIFVGLSTPVNRGFILLL